MAILPTLCFTPSLTFSTHQTHNSSIVTHKFSTSIFTHKFSTRPSTRIFVDTNDFLGDFGARDPFPAEIESNFCDNVGIYDTEHKILIPNIAAMSLSQQECTPVSPLQSPMSEDDAKSLLRKVIGWRLVNESGIRKLQCLWKLKDSDCAVELLNRINKAVGSTSHFPNIQLEQIEPNQVKAEIWTASIGGLSLNDFIVASKIDAIRTSDLVPRKRAWA